jgi:hypothetical protein
MADQMSIAKAMLDKSVEGLIDKAEDCFDLAKAGHAQADSQHEVAATQHQNAEKVDANADRLETLGRALVGDALELKGEMEFVAARASHTLPGGTEGIRLKPGSLTAPKVER